MSKKKNKIEISDFGSSQLVQDKKNNQLIRPVDNAKFHVVYPMKGQRHLQRIDDHILMVYKKRKLLDPINQENNDKRYFAGARIRDLADRSNIHDRVIPNYSSFLVMVYGGKEASANVDKFDSYQELHQALVYAVKYNSILWKCCVNDEKAGNKIENFRKGLDLLIEYFRIK
jgi:hypothetical protein|tara:strand:- start:418 stop:933 length:516 start_codon:yes stop_codon:yes gene_type:complete